MGLILYCIGGCCRARVCFSKRKSSSKTGTNPFIFCHSPVLNVVFDDMVVGSTCQGGSHMPSSPYISSFFFPLAAALSPLARVAAAAATRVPVTGSSSHRTVIVASALATRASSCACCRGCVWLTGFDGVGGREGGKREMGRRRHVRPTLSCGAHCYIIKTIFKMGERQKKK